MSMTRQQLITVFSFLSLFLLLYFVFDTKPKNKQKLDRTNTVNNNVDIDVELKNAKSKLIQDSLIVINNLESELISSNNDTAKTEILKKISGWWYRQKNFALAGLYAEKVAEIENNDVAWAIAATTFAEGTGSTDDQTKKFCIDKSRSSFEKAVALAPNNIAHKVNLALSFADNPPADNPMKGIQMLLELGKENPDESIVQLTLAKLAIKTGQYDKATARLQKLLDKNPNDNNANCLLFEIYSIQGNLEKAEDYHKKCK